MCECAREVKKERRSTTAQVDGEDLESIVVVLQKDVLRMMRTKDQQRFLCFLTYSRSLIAGEADNDHLAT